VDLLAGAGVCGAGEEDLGAENHDRRACVEAMVSDWWGHKGTGAHWQWLTEAGVTRAGSAHGLGRHLAEPARGIQSKKEKCLFLFPQKFPNTEE
jgi:hypothetical protein